MFRNVRNVILAVVSGFAILADICAVETVVAGVTWPHPVVSITTEFADTFGRCVYQTDVTDFHLFDHVKLKTAIVWIDVATVTGIFFTFGNQGFGVFFYRVNALFAFQFRNIFTDDFVRNVGDFFGDKNT